MAPCTSRVRRPPVPAFGVAIATFALSSCVISLPPGRPSVSVGGVAPPTDGAPQNLLILGAAWVRTADAPSGNAHVRSVHAVGLTASGSGSVRLSAGLVALTETAVDDGVEDLRIEVSQRPWGPLRIRTNEAVCPARLESTAATLK